MTRWSEYRTNRTLSEMGMAPPEAAASGGGGGGILDRAEAEIEKHFADFEAKMMQALGQKKDSWLSWGVKKLGNSLTGDERAQKSKYYGIRGTLGNLTSRAGEWLRPRTAMEKQYKLPAQPAAAAAAEAAETMVGIYLKENRKGFAQLQLSEADAQNTIPSWIEELKGKVRATLEKAVSDMFHVMTKRANAQAQPVKQTKAQAALSPLVAKYGSVDAIPPEEVLAALGHKPLAKGGFGAATRKALAGMPPVAKPITDPRQIGYE